jgi:hypothetical protein
MKLLQRHAGMTVEPDVGTVQHNSTNFEVESHHVILHCFAVATAKPSRQETRFNCSSDIVFTSTAQRNASSANELKDVTPLNKLELVMYHSEIHHLQIT